ncbi:IS transposase [Lactobacillus selangorensis]|uniref:IS transposase n=1 Tax=Lactobacillus selangorensis TaxID=81857 RepID=A0A0R2FEC7_9LACO|nr:helix-turn-helix domain-containing protein [Lactobacillus selangorensis]KRN26867.1 IS transposase [Lactobacillus selangorensis]KRN28518.1 IS transposase [Lactobacillus selangorensis]
MNPLSWRKSKSGGFTMFSVEIKKKVILEYLEGKPAGLLMKKYGIKGSATIYQWLSHFKMFGIQGLENDLEKTYYDYSFKMEVIHWRSAHRASFPVAAQHFRLKNPVIIWDWEKKLLQGRLKSTRGRSSKMTKPKDEKTLKQLQDENDFLRARVAYLEKLDALIQKKKKSQIKKKPK